MRIQTQTCALEEYLDTGLILQVVKEGGARLHQGDLLLWGRVQPESKQVRLDKVQVRLTLPVDILLLITCE